MQFSNQLCSLAADALHALRAGAFSFYLMRPSGNMVAIHSPALQHIAAGKQGAALFNQWTGMVQGGYGISEELSPEEIEAC